MSGFTGRYSVASYKTSIKCRSKPRTMWKEIMGLKGTTAKIYKGKTTMKGNVPGHYIKVSNFPGMTDAIAKLAVRRLRYRKMKASLMFRHPRTGETWIALHSYNDSR